MLYSFAVNEFLYICMLIIPHASIYHAQAANGYTYMVYAPPQIYPITITYFPGIPRISSLTSIHNYDK